MKRHLSRMFRKGEVGQSIVILALGFIGLLAVVGIATDVSILFARYTQLRRAVDAAAIGAAAQMRQDRGIETVNLTARQYVEFHGINPRDVWVDTCETLRVDADPAEPGYQPIPGAPPVDEEVCPPDDTRKLVRVVAQVESPTVFLRLVGWGNVTLQASAISETAVLDVVIVLDVSESMLSETTYVDWAEAGQGYATIPPRLDRGSDAWVTTAYQDTVLYRMSVANTGADITPGTGFLPTVENGLQTHVWAPDAPQDIPGYVSGINDLNLRWWWHDWFWQTHLLSVPQEQVNDRIYYEPPTGISAIGESTGPPTPDPSAPKNIYYRAQTFLPDDVQAAITEGDVPANQVLPREACRVRFYPYSFTLDVPSYELQRYQAQGQPWLPLWTGNMKWAGFIPSYNFFGCCNDPGNATVDDIGRIIPAAAPTTEADGNFSDLVCQPFKQARDATRLFLDRVDFERGDRVAFVTFDRAAHLIDPDGPLGEMAPMISRFEDTNGTTYGARNVARQILDTSIGVRAEPNFYIWDDAGFGIRKSPGMDVGGWTITGSANGEPAYSQGLDQATGLPIPIDYYADTLADRWGQSTVDYNQYPVGGNCYFNNAALTYPITRYANRNTPQRDNQAALTNFMIPDIYTDPYWANIRVNGMGGVISPNKLSHGSNSYELWAGCRGTNIGAALREANNALTDPATSRREGTVWIIIFLGDGAAGASDPARINGRLPDQPQPYTAVSENYDWTLGTRDDDGNLTYNQYGDRGEYGFYGVCPPGGRENFDNADYLGELILTEFPGNEPAFPYCSDESPYTRHFCVPTVQAVVGGDSSVGEPNYQAGFGPGARDEDFDPNNPSERNIYDIDVGQYGNESQCSILYDVDDYARDWADFVAGVGQVNQEYVEAGGDDSVLPTIFTIGFGLNFTDRDGDGEIECEENIEECLGEELLRYIADAGDNFRIDNDYQQDYRRDLSLGSSDADLGDGGYGTKDPCQAQDVDYIPNNLGTIVPFPHGESCGNYYNAPGQAELQQVFDDIASRMFTRLAG